MVTAILKLDGSHTTSSFYQFVAAWDVLFTNMDMGTVTEEAEVTDIVTDQEMLVIVMNPEETLRPAVKRISTLGQPSFTSWAIFCRASESSLRP